MKNECIYTQISINVYILGFKFTRSHSPSLKKTHSKYMAFLVLFISPVKMEGLREGKYRFTTIFLDL